MSGQPDAGQPPWWSTTKVEQPAPPKKGRGHKKSSGAPSNKHPKAKAQPHPTKIKSTRGHTHAKKAAGGPGIHGGGGGVSTGGGLVSQGPYQTAGPIGRYEQVLASHSSVHGGGGEGSAPAQVTEEGRVHLGKAVHSSHRGRHHVSPKGGRTHASSGHRGHVHSSAYTISDLRRAAGSRVTDAFLAYERYRAKHPDRPTYVPPDPLLEAAAQGHVGMPSKGGPPAGWEELDTGEWVPPGTKLRKGEHLMPQTKYSATFGMDNPVVGKHTSSGRHKGGSKDSRKHRGASVLELTGTSFLGKSGQSSHATAPPAIGVTTYRRPGHSVRHK